MIYGQKGVNKMKKKKEGFLRQVKSKQPILGTLVITLMLLATAIFFVGFVPEKVKAASTDYAYYKAITIESDYISAALTNFPILVHDSTGGLSGNVLANGSDIAFYAVGNSTQYNHEIEYYDSATGELWAWVNVTSIASGTDTLFYMYYDDSDGIYPVGHNPTSVWDSNYAGIYHFNGTTIEDSTSNNKDLTNHGAVSQTDGIAGGCYNFTSGDSDYADVAAITDISALTQITIEAWVRATAIGGSALNAGIMIGEYNTAVNADTDLIWFLVRRADGKLQSCFATPYQLDVYLINHSTQIFFNHIWTYAAMTVDENVGAVGTLWDYTNGEFVGVGDTSVGGATDFSNIVVDVMNVGRDHRSTTDYYFDGSFDEVRISKVLRSDSWLNTSYHSQNETIGFLTLGIQESADVSSYQIIGLSNGIITWGSVSDTTVYCNSSGDANEWLEVNMSINATDNVTEIRVFVGDLNDTTAYINASNITLYVTNASNTTYYSFGTFLDGGSNITINQSTWNTYAYALSNPFNVTGLRNTNTSIFLIFKLAIPASLQTDVFWSTSSTVWKIYIGYLT